MRVRNEAWLAPWEGRSPRQAPASWAERNSPAVFAARLRQDRREARAGRRLPFAVRVGRRLVGAVTIGGIERGASDSAYVGYWVDRDVAGRGVTTAAVALVLDHCFGPVGLHRVEAHVRPENAASRRVVAKLGMREEGLHLRYLFIDEAWRDHLTYALTLEELPAEGLTGRHRRSYGAP